MNSSGVCLLFVRTTIFFCFCFTDINAQLNPSSKQLMILTAENWNTSKGHLWAFDKHDSAWIEVFNFPIVIGRSGFGFDSACSFKIDGGVPLKHEGDGRSPAGFFQLGPAFGYAKMKDVSWMNLAYLQSNSNVFCVDDEKSTHYNRIVKSDTTSKDWRSAEDMRRSDDYYKWGIVVNYNYPQTVPARGSCIFMHIWENDSTGTVGCTAMSEKNILRLLHWLDQKKSPMLIQFPIFEYKIVSRQFNLPVL